MSLTHKLVRTHNFTKGTKEVIEFEETLSVPIGPDMLMDELGVYHKM
jgi:hypothetical protein